MNATRQSSRTVWGICLFLLAATALAYWQVVQNDFVNFDDPDYVTLNPHIQKGPGWQTIVWAFSSSYKANWHPLTWLSHALDCRLYDLKPAGHHLTSLILHLANSVLAFLVLRRLTGTLWRSALVAALFAWHPSHVESVAWVTERKDVLSTFFGLLALGSYARYVKFQVSSSKFQIRTWAWYGLALAFFACSLMSKPMLVTLPFLFLLVDYWPLGRVSGMLDTRYGIRDTGYAIRDQVSGETNRGFLWPSLRRLIVEKLPFFALAVLSCWITVVAQHGAGAVADLSASNRAANVLVSYVRYIGMTLWPTHLAVIYPRPPEWPAVWVAGAAVVLLCLSLGALLSARRSPYFFTGWFWFLGTLVPVIGIITVGVQAIADRYTYVPSVGLFIALAWGLEQLCRGWPRARFGIIAAAGMALAACLGGTWRQVQFWKNSETLFQHAVTVNPDNAIAHTCLGMTLENEQGRLDEAREHYSIAAQINTNDLDAIVCQGLVLCKLDRLDEAIDLLARTAKRIPDSFLEYNLANALARKGLLADAEQHYRTALALKTDFADAHRDLALTLVVTRRLDEAVPEFVEVVRLNPGAQSYHDLASVTEWQGKAGEAAALYRKSLALDPDFLPALNSLAWLLATHPDSSLRDGAEAVRLARRACDLTRFEQAELVATLAAACAETGRFADAIKAGEKSMELARTAGRNDLVERSSRMLKSFRAGEAWHEPVKSKSDLQSEAARRIQRNQFR